jgi:hypothetical protein
MPVNPWITTPLHAGAIPTNSYACTIGGLSANTIYEYRAYMVVSGTPYCGEICQITTLAPTLYPPTVCTGNGGAITTTGMTIIDNCMLFKGNQAIAEYGVLYTQNAAYGTPANLQYQNLPLHVKSASISGDITEGDLYSDAILNLSPNTVAYYRAFAKNNSGCGYGVVCTQQTADVPPELTISSSPTNAGQGTLDFCHGVGGETLQLSFVVHKVGLFDSIEFTQPVNVDGILNANHLTQTGSVTLVGGEAHADWTYYPQSDIPDTYTVITITSRTGGPPVPVLSTTTLYAS